MNKLLLILCLVLGSSLSSKAASTSSPGYPHPATHHLENVGSSQPVSKRAKRRAKRQKIRQLRQQLFRRGDSPAGKFFLSLGLAIAFGALAVLFIEIPPLSLAMTILGGIMFFAALWFLIRWLYYYW